jgi:serine/threonine-protein kinase
MPPGEIVPIAGQILAALAWAHGRKALHGDLKPDNIMVTPEGVVKVLDFGQRMAPRGRPRGCGAAAARAGGSISRARLATASVDPNPPGDALATPAYMSPEQARGEPVDGRSDLFSFGVVLYEMANGRRPFKGRTPIELIASILKDEPSGAVAGGCGSGLDRIVRRCLEKNPRLRYRSAGQILAEINDSRRTAFFADAVRKAAGSGAGASVREIAGGGL